MSHRYPYLARICDQIVCWISPENTQKTTKTKKDDDMLEIEPERVGQSIHVRGRTDQQARRVCDSPRGLHFVHWRRLG